MFGNPRLFCMRSEAGFFVQAPRKMCRCSIAVFCLGSSAVLPVAQAFLSEILGCSPCCTRLVCLWCEAVLSVISDRSTYCLRLFCQWSEHDLSAISDTRRFCLLPKAVLSVIRGYSACHLRLYFLLFEAVLSVILGCSSSEPCLYCLLSKAVLPMIRGCSASDPRLFYRSDAACCLRLFGLLSEADLSRVQGCSVVNRGYCACDPRPFCLWSKTVPPVTRGCSACDMFLYWQVQNEANSCGNYGHLNLSRKAAKKPQTWTIISNS